MIDAGAAFVAWLGASLLVLSDGRRGLALGTVLATVAMAVLALDHANLVAAAAIAVGGAVAATRRFGSGTEGWGIMPAGSTPRLVLCIAAGLLALWIAAGVTTGPGAPLRFTVMLVAGLAATRVFSSADPPALLTATALLALAVGLGAALSDTATGPWPYLAAGLIAGAVQWLPLRTAHAA